MCFGWIEPEGTSGRSGVKVKKFSPSMSVISTPSLRRNLRSSRRAIAVPANPPPMMTMCSGGSSSAGQLSTCVGGARESE